VRLVDEENSAYTHQNLKEKLHNGMMLKECCLEPAQQPLIDTISFVMLLQRLFADCQEVGDLLYNYIGRQHGALSTGLNAAAFTAGVRDIVDLGGESYPMDFYFNVFSGGAKLTKNGILHL